MVDPLVTGYSDEGNISCIGEERGGGGGGCGIGTNLPSVLNCVPCRASFLAGILGTAATNPIDVVKVLKPAS